MTEKFYSMENIPAEQVQNRIKGLEQLLDGRYGVMERGL